MKLIMPADSVDTMEQAKQGKQQYAGSFEQTVICDEKSFFDSQKNNLNIFSNKGIRKQTKNKEKLQ